MLDPMLIGGLGIAAMLLAILLGVHIGVSLGIVGFLGCVVLIGFPKSASVLATTPFYTAADYSFIVLPMFILMGEIAFQGGIGTLLYAAASKWLGRLHGGLAMATAASVALFAVVTGSSLATAATFSRVAVPEMLRHGYDSKLAAAVVACSGTLAALIPPSGLMVFFCIFTRVSLGKLLIAGLIPGFLSALVYMLMIYSRVRLNPSLAPLMPEMVSWRERILSVRWITPVGIVGVVMLGGIYAGVFSPVEAGAIGAFAVLLVVLARRSFSLSGLKTSVLNTAQTSAMIFFIIIGAMIFGKFLVLTGLPSGLAVAIGSLAWPPMMILILVLLMYILLGTFLDVIAMLAITLPIFFPLLSGLGFDGVWLGILIIKMVEIAAITPPIGLNVYVTKGVVGDVVSLGGLFQGIWPFFLMDVLTLAILVAFPQISLWLPSTMF